VVEACDVGKSYSKLEKRKDEMKEILMYIREKICEWNLR